jgi:anaphase-promoting complex subunit 1
VAGLQNAVGNRVTLQLAGGGNTRVALPFAPTGPLATSAMEALHAVLPADTYWALYARWLTEGGASSADAEAQWQALARVVLAWAADPSSLSLAEDRPPQLHLPRPSGASSGTTATTTTPQRQLSTANASVPTGQAAWQQLLRSDHHRRHGSRFAWAPAAQPAQEEGHMPATAAAVGAGRDEAWRALQALHSVYEDCKMSVLRWQLLPSLGRALLRLAGLLGASGYADHYARDLGLPAEPAAAPGAAAQAGASPSQAVASAAPPDMFRALQALLGGQRDGGGAVPLLAAQKAGCVRRSADLLAAYGLLAEAAASLGASLSLEAAQASDLLQAAAHRIVRLLVRQRWTLADLDCLPWGVALPLRQAIQHCRSSPPTDWPQEAYVLIGRNDIAASMAAAEQEERPAEVGRLGH